MKKYVSAVCAAGVLAGALTASAEVFYAKKNITDWTVKASYCTDSTLTVDADRVPAAGDEVWIPNGVTSVISDRDSFDQMNLWNRVVPGGIYARLQIAVPSGETWTNACPFNRGGSSRTGDHFLTWGEMIKTGAGAMELKLPSRYVDGNYNIDFNSSLTAKEGTLYLPRHTFSSVFFCYALAVSNNATAFLCPASGKNYLCQIFNEGLVTNTTSAGITLTGTSVSDLKPTTSGGGGLFANIPIFAGANKVWFTGTNNTLTSSSVTVNGNSQRGPGFKGELGIRRFGKKDETVSSIGKTETVYLGAGGNVTANSNGGLRICAREEDGAQETDKDILFRHHSFSFVDAGDYGNVTFKGKFTTDDVDGSKTSTYRMGDVRLYGSNSEKACTIAAAINPNAYNGTNYYIHLTKKGSGIWRLADEKTTKNTNRYRQGLSAITVEEGVFQYDSLKRKYDWCALGEGHHTASAYTGLYDPSKDVAWTFALGAQGKKGILEYTGTAPVNAGTRPIVIRGDAGLRNSTATFVRYRALPTEGDFAKTLTLDGTSTGDNELGGVTDTGADYPLSLVKEGTGKWIVSGDVTLHGSVTVSAGELVVRKYEPKYSWFRWTLKRSITNDAVTLAKEGIVAAHTLGLYDAKTIRQNADLTVVAKDSLPVLQPGQACFETQRNYDVTSGRGLDNLFGDTRGYGMYLKGIRNNLGNATTLSLDDPTTWWPIVMRLTNGAPEVVAWDYVLYTNPSGSNGDRGVGTTSLEGSVDGLHWDNVIGGDKVITDLPSKDYCWMSGGSANKGYINGNAQKHMSSSSIYAIPDDWKFTRTTPDAFSVFENVGQVTVAGGAKLTADGEGLTISSLKVDASAASDAQISGFSFAENGTLEIVNKKPGTVAVPLAVTGDGQTFSNVASWSVTGLKSGYRVIVKNGRLTLAPPPGFMVLIR